MKTHLASGLCFLVALASSACTIVTASPQQPPANDAGGVDTQAIDQACTTSAAAQCAKVQSCNPASLEASYGDLATCQARVKLGCMTSLMAPDTGNTAERTTACAQAYATYACDDYRNHVNIPDACLQATGARADGAGCVYAAQCGSGFCAIQPGDTCGVCQIAPSIGDACDNLTSCGQGLICASDSQTCVTYAASGDTCGYGAPCGAGLSCVAPGGSGTDGVCEPAGVKVGATCDGSRKTGPSCDSALELYCDGVTKRCASTQYESSGTCGYDATSGSYTSCSAGSCQSGACVARASDGMECDPSLGTAACVSPARCTNDVTTTSTCQLPAPDSCN
jgi:hypothetical protein